MNETIETAWAPVDWFAGMTSRAARAEARKLIRRAGESAVVTQTANGVTAVLSVNDLREFATRAVAEQWTGKSFPG